ncbi:MAG TPA: NAD-dependent epimerase/dehydratase family protein [Aquihabitans sp.]|nr:NAD-dependent epimerase/dehydratase family protein [Aquihabitans sp.]
MRALITGMGGELGTRVANLLEADDTWDQVVGIDGYPPRRRTTRASFHRIDPRDRRKAVHLVRDLDPEVVFHLGVYEPNARFEPTEARLGSAASAVSVLGAATACPSLRAIVVRSGIEVYGRRRGAPTRPDESAAVDPTTPFGRSMVHVEQVAGEAGRVAGVPVASLRFGPIVGPSFPSPLGRYLRLPVVAVAPHAELPFCLTHQEDAARALVAAGAAQVDGPLNVVGPGAVTASQAVRRGGRVPLPVAGPGWWLARAAAELLGAPLPPHTRELLIRGGVADGAAARALLDVEPRSTDDVITQLYEWGTVARVTPAGRGASA